MVIHGVYLIACKYELMEEEALTSLVLIMSISQIRASRTVTDATN